MDNRKRGSRKPRPVPVPVPDPAMFTGLLGEIAGEASLGTEADKVGIYACLLSMAGVQAGPKPHITIGDRRHPLLIWPMLAGRTGSGRKGDAMASALNIMTYAFPIDFDDRIVTGLSTGEGLIWHIRDPDDDGNGTDDKRVLVYEEELGHIIAVSSKETSTLSGVLRKAWDGGRLQALTKNPYKASSSHVAVIAAITPGEFRARVSNRDLASGLWNRYLPLFVERRELIAVPTGMSFDLKTEYAEEVSKAVTLVSQMEAIGLSRQATELYTDEIYPELADLSHEEGRVADFLERGAPYCRRIAALTGALAGKKATPADDLEAAAHLVRYSIASARYALDTAEHDPRIDRLRRAVDEAYPRALSGEDVRDLFNRHLKSAQTRQLTDDLCNDPAYELEEVPTGGRPRMQLRRVLPFP